MNEDFLSEFREVREMVFRIAGHEQERHDVFYKLYHACCVIIGLLAAILAAIVIFS